MRNHPQSWPSTFQVSEIWLNLLRRVIFSTTSSQKMLSFSICSSLFLGQTCSQNWTMRFMVSLCPLISWVLFSSFGHIPISWQAVQLNDDYLRGSNQSDVLISFSFWIYHMYQYFLLLISSMWNIVISKIRIPIDSVVRIMDMTVSEANRLEYMQRMVYTFPRDDDRQLHTSIWTLQRDWDHFYSSGLMVNCNCVQQVPINGHVSFYPSRTSHHPHRELHTSDMMWCLNSEYVWQIPCSSIVP